MFVCVCMCLFVHVYVYPRHEGNMLLFHVSETEYGNYACVFEAADAGNQVQGVKSQITF